MICTECSLNYCLKHRHPVDHSCEGKVAKRSWLVNPQRSTVNNMSEDEALARALALSMQDSAAVFSDKKRQEELDLALARQLQSAESTSSTTTISGIYRRDRCNVS